MTNNRSPESRVQAADEEPGAAYLCLDHQQTADALHRLHACAERELIRLSWLMSMPIIPPATYHGAVRRVIAEALDSVWGDYDGARRALSPELHKELLWLISGWPMSDLDWAMRIFAISAVIPQPEVTL